MPTESLILSERRVNPFDPTLTQREIIEAIDAGYHRVICVGSTRLGKSAGFIIGLVYLVYRSGIQYERPLDHLVISPTLGNIHRNLLTYLEEVCEAFDLEGKLHGGNKYTISLQGTPLGHIYLFGAEKSDSPRRIKGMTIHSAFVDEVVECHEDFMAMLLTRFSYRDSVLLLGTNASSPYHWFKTKWVDQSPPLTYHCVHTTTDLNHHYPQEKWEEQLADPSMPEYHKRRLLFNEWRPAAGLCIPVYDDMITEREPVFEGPTGFDYGLGSVTASVLFEPTSYGWHVNQVFGWDARKQGALDNEAYLQMLLTRWRPTVIHSDPSAISFRATCSRMGLRAEKSKNKVIPGIAHVNAGLAKGRLTIDKRCRPLLEELSAYVLNEHLDAPIKHNDHFADALRYGWVSIEPPYDTKLGEALLEDHYDLSEFLAF